MCSDKGSSLRANRSRSLRTNPVSVLAFSYAVAASHSTTHSHLLSNILSSIHFLVIIIAYPFRRLSRKQGSVCEPRPFTRHCRAAAAAR